ncbi:MAG: Spy/CpxP family protein refolding chaperone [Fibrobacter sp.]|nr:Spy/CpxP family protein refolding chaperone [Fibrobacter sp.]
MNGVNKFLMASTIVLACAVGFFLGCMFGCPGCMNKMKDCPHMQAMEGQPFPPPPPGEFKHGDFHKGHGHHGDFHKGHEHHGPKGPHGDWKNGPKPDFAAIDSVMQVTPEQKAKLEANRTSMDSAFKELRKQKMEAEKALREALDSGNDANIEAAKAKVKASQDALLEHRITGVAQMNQILTKEQREKFKAYNQEKFRRHMPPPQFNKQMPSPPMPEQPKPQN